MAPLRSCGRLFFMVEGVAEAFDIEIFVAHEYTGTITEYVSSFLYLSSHLLTRALTD